MANRYQLKLTLGLICLLTLTLSFCVGQVVLAETNPADVPPSHWAYKAVKLLVDKGYLQLYQDQTFKGEKPVDRYTMAVVVAKILNEIAGGKVGTNQGDMDLVKKLTNEYWNELVQVNSKNNLFVQKIDQVVKDNQVIKEDITRNTAATQQLGDDQDALRQNVAKNSADIQTLQGQTGQNSAAIQTLQGQVSQNSADIQALSSDRDVLQKKVAQNSEDIAKNSQDIAQNSAAIQKLADDQAAQQKAFQEQAQQIIAEIQKLTARVQKLEEENSMLQADIDRMRIENEQNRKKQNGMIIAAIVLGLIGVAK